VDISHSVQQSSANNALETPGSLKPSQYLCHPHKVLEGLRIKKTPALRCKSATYSLQPHLLLEQSITLLIIFQGKVR